MRRTMVVGLSAGLMALACGGRESLENGGPGGGGGTLARPSVLDELAWTHGFELDPTSSKILLKGGQRGAEAPLVIRPTSGRLALRTEGDSMQVSTLRVEIADIRCCQSRFPPDGLRFSNIEASLRFSSMGAQWMGPEVGAVFQGPASLHITWNVGTRTATMTPMPIEVPVVEVEGFVGRGVSNRIVLDLEGKVPGPIFEADDVLSLVDLDFALTLEDAGTSFTPNDSGRAGGAARRAE